MATINQTLGTDLAALAQLLRSKGRGKDTVLAHITPKEAALLKKRGGRGSTNPITGLLEFDDGEGGDFAAPAQEAPVQQDIPAPAPTPAENPYGGPGDLGFTPSANAPDGTSFNVPSPVDTTQTAAFNPLNYGSAFGTDAQSYQGTPGLPTPAYAAPAAGATSFGTGGAAYVDPSQPGAATQLEPPPTPTDTTGTQPTTGDKGTGTPSGLSDLLKGLGISGATAARLGLGAGLGAYGASQANKTASQIAQAQGQQQAIAQPYQSQGQQLINQAQSGSLSPASQQAYSAAKAQLAQQQSNRGGVGAQQAANQLSNIYQTLLNNQYTYGVNLMQIGDNISLGAIKTGLQLDQQLNTATTNFYSQLANFVAGGNIQQPYAAPAGAQSSANPLG